MTRLGADWEWETKVMVNRSTDDPKRSGNDAVDETEIFSGIENSLIMTQTYTRNFQCNYALLSSKIVC